MAFYFVWVLTCPVGQVHFSSTCPTKKSTCPGANERKRAPHIYRGAFTRCMCEWTDQWAHLPPPPPTSHQSHTSPFPLPFPLCQAPPPPSLSYSLFLPQYRTVRLLTPGDEGQSELLHVFSMRFYLGTHKAPLSNVVQMQGFCVQVLCVFLQDVFNPVLIQYLPLNSLTCANIFFKSDGEKKTRTVEDRHHTFLSNKSVLQPAAYIYLISRDREMEGVREREYVLI